MYNQIDVETGFQTENVFASFKVNFILRNTNTSAVNITMYILTRHAFVNNTDTPDQIYITPGSFK